MFKCLDIILPLNSTYNNGKDQRYNIIFREKQISVHIKRISTQGLKCQRKQGFIRTKISVRHYLRVFEINVYFTDFLKFMRRTHTLLSSLLKSPLPSLRREQNIRVLRINMSLKTLYEDLQNNSSIVTMTSMSQYRQKISNISLPSYPLSYSY